MKKLRHAASSQAGFTLAELLVVVAIVGVLVAIAVPVFTGALGQTQEATCAGNRRTVKVMVSDAYLLDNNLEVNDAYVKEVADKLKEGNSDHDLCPSGGTYSLGGTFTKGSDSSIVIKCSVHGLSADEEMYGWVQGTYEDSWKTYLKYTGKDGVDRNGDEALRYAYAEANGIDEWPEITRVGNTPYYLQMKSYNNQASGTFLYAGPSSSIENSNSWRAKYIRDNAGQWYELPEVTGIANLDAESFAKLCESGTKGAFVNGTFVAE